MNSDAQRYWIVVAFLLVIIIGVSSVVIWVKQNKGEEVLVFTSQPDSYVGQIWIDGAVSRPGIYPLKNSDSIDAILRAAGGLSTSADLSRLKIYVPQTQDNSEPQKVDLNHAEIWLLQALPDIGETRAENIVQYRQQNGFFHDISELTNVPGINNSTFQKIKGLVTITN